MIAVAFCSDNRRVHVQLHDVAHAPLMSYSLILLPCLALKGHMYGSETNGVTFKLETGKTVHFPLIGKRCRHYGYSPEANSRVVALLMTS